jgi:hypothetical protein
MHARSRCLVFVIAASVLLASCKGAFSRKYEYDEDVYIALDGSATVYLNASVPALVALRGLDLDPDPRARFDRSKVRALFETPIADVESITTSRRDGRRYVHLRIAVSDVRRLNEAAPFAWSSYDFFRKDDVLVYRQVVGRPAGRDVAAIAGWTGQELVAFRLHLPSRVPWFNAPSREIERGNIIRWEQPLRERLQGRPVEIEVHLEPESILLQTLTLFAVTIVLAAITFGAAIFWVVRKRANDFATS